MSGVILAARPEHIVQAPDLVDGEVDLGGRSNPSSFHRDGELTRLMTLFEQVVRRVLA